MKLKLVLTAAALTVGASAFAQTPARVVNVS